MRKILALLLALLPAGLAAQTSTTSPTSVYPQFSFFGQDNTFTGTNTLTGVTSFTGAASFTSTLLATGVSTFGSAADAANTVRLGEVASCVVFEGSSADAHETRLCAVNATVGDGTVNIPDVGAAATRTLAVLEAAQTFTATKTHTDIVVNKSLQGFSVQTLADNVAEDFVEIGCPAGDGSGGTINYYAYAENGTTEAQAETGTIQWNCLNLSGTEVCPTPTEVGTPLHAETTGGTADLTTTWNCTVGLASVIRIGVAVNNGLASPTLVEIRYRVNVHSGSAVTVTALQ